MVAQPTKVKQTSPTELSITWNDGHESRIRLTTLRDLCPCAGCKGETVLLRTYIPPSPDKSSPGRYKLTNAEVIGNYALKLTWADGHDTGIYHWEYLRSLCECDLCAAHKPSEGFSDG
jgi:DUF971 family protein